MAEAPSDLPSNLTLLSTCTPPSTSRAWSSAPHPTQPYIATACADKTVRIYSLTSFTLLSTITGGHKRSVRCCAWKPSLPSSKSAAAADSILATGSFDASAAIWVGRPSGGEEGVHEGLNRTIDDYDPEVDDDEGDFRFAVVLEGHDSEIKSIAWSAHGTFLATCSRDKSVWIWEALDPGLGEGGFSVPGQGVDDEDNYETVAVMQEHDGDVKCVAWHPVEEQCLVSASYDDDVRVWREDIEGEWGCVAVCSGHDGTVWCVDWEPWGPKEDSPEEIKREDARPESGPRIISCSDDQTIRLWRRKPKHDREQPGEGPRIPSTIRSSSDEEEWFEDGRLPQRHERAIYTVAWSKKSKRVVSCGSDGKLVVYEEQAHPSTGGGSALKNGDAEHSTAGKSNWTVVAEVESAHGVFEINHVCWARRVDRGKRSIDEEIIISTGDDGEVNIWTLDI